MLSAHLLTKAECDQRETVRPLGCRRHNAGNNLVRRTTPRNGGVWIEAFSRLALRDEQSPIGVTRTP